MRIDFNSEEELEKIIDDHWNETGVLMIDQTKPDMLCRQMVLEPYGIADLVGISYNNVGSSLLVEIYELKKEKITASAIAQAYRYKAAFENTLDKLSGDFDYFVSVNVVGTSIDDSCFMVGYTDIHYYQVTFEPFEGISFINHDGTWKRGEGPGGTSVASVLEALDHAKLRADERSAHEEKQSKPLAAVK